MMREKIWIVCGGRSAEHDVSLASAKFIFDVIDKRLFSRRIVYAAPDGRWLKAPPKILAESVCRGRVAVSSPSLDVFSELSSPSSRPAAVFPVLHGSFGEDGTVQGLFELCGVPYVGCGVLASAAGMDKEISKRLAERAKIAVLPYRPARSLAEARAAAEAIGYPVFVKPARQGSSVGVRRVKNKKVLSAAASQAFLYDDKIIVEKALAAREIECGVLGDPAEKNHGHTLGLRASLCGEVRPNAEFYTYESKYLDPNGARRFIPAPISTREASRAREMSLAAFGAIGGYAMGRVDFLMDKKSGRLYFNEINTIPGFTAASMYPALWKASGIEPPDLVGRLISLALRRAQARSRLMISPPGPN
ncbi:MAG: D-alanine--D-alanine ligase family protein [Elusimicrobiota bacterium]